MGAKFIFKDRMFAQQFSKLAHPHRNNIITSVLDFHNLALISSFLFCKVSSVLPMDLCRLGIQRHPFPFRDKTYRICFQKHRDITSFRPWSTIATGNLFDHVEKIPKFVQTTGTVYCFYPRSGILELTSRRASVCSILHE